MNMNIIKHVTVAHHLNRVGTTHIQLQPHYGETE